MLPLANRLKRKKDIDRVFSRGAAKKKGFLICKTAQNNSDESRFCFVVSKKISANATVRNKLKRRLRESVRLFMSQIVRGRDCVIIACPGSERVDFRAIKEAVAKILAQSGVLNVNSKI